jgi:predicted outer membrane lipoprotein
MQTPLRLAVLALVAVGTAQAESALTFVDLRVQGGVTADDGEAASMTVMAGDIGNKDNHIISFDADMGVVLGLRGQVSKVTAERDDGLGDLDLTLGGGTLMGGFGFYFGKHSHGELLFGYARGVGTTTGSTPWDQRDTSFIQYQGEIGWYYTWETGLQLGLTAGYSVIKATWSDRVNDVDVKAEAKGIDGALSLGYRF